MRSATLEELARLVGGTLAGAPNLVIEDAATISTAKRQEITFADSPSAIAQLGQSQASAAVLPVGTQADGVQAIMVEDVLEAFTQIVSHFRPPPARHRCGVHPDAYVSPTATLGENVDVLPGAYIGDGVHIADGCWIGPHATLLPGCRISEDVTIYPQAVLYENTVVGPRCVIHAGAILGAHGFGYKTVDGRHELSAQLGFVELDADVEVGAVTTIDRGTFGRTQVGKGTKLDNHVMVAHNCQLGKHNLLCSQVGIAGSSTTGDYVVMAGQVGVPDHVRIGHRAILGAKAGVLRDVPDSMTVLGIPATPERQQMQIQAAIARLPELRREIRRMRRELQDLQAESSSPPADEKDAA